MALYKYVKEKKTKTRRAMQMISYITLTTGTLILFCAFYPVISFEIYSRFFLPNISASPIPLSMGITAQGFDNEVLGSSTKYSNNLRDFTQASLWFPSVAKVVSSATTPSKAYSISIPKINIYDAKVSVGGEDLSKSLVHYQPVSMPGSVGNTVIFGHSSLPQLFNVNNYKTIFTFLPSLNEGDVIKVNLQNATYDYVVSEMFVVKPDQVSVLNQTTDSSILTLVTCVPPGTWWNRLVVRAKLKSTPDQLRD
ncbi:MAG: sortase [Microgenomates group bacterium]